MRRSVVTVSMLDDLLLDVNPNFGRDLIRLDRRNSWKNQLGPSGISFRVGRTYQRE